MTLKLQLVLVTVSMFVAACSQRVQSVEEKKERGPFEAVKLTAPATVEKATALNEASFDTTIAKGVVLVDFWATWCPPCKRQGPIVDAVAKRMSGKAKVAKLDIDKAQAIAKRFNVQSIPTLIIFKDGKPVQTLVGLTQEDDIVRALENAGR